MDPIKEHNARVKDNESIAKFITNQKIFFQS